MIQALAILLRVLAALFLIRMGLRFVAAFLRGLTGAHAPEPDSELVRDRVCNTFLPRSRALLFRVNGEPQHFCSEACRDRALAVQGAP